MSQTGSGAEAPARRRRLNRDYWRRTRVVTLALLIVWAAVTFLPIWFAPAMDGVRFLGWPLAYFLVAQVSLVVFVAIVWSYALVMEWLDRRLLEKAPLDGEGRG